MAKKDIFHKETETLRSLRALEEIEKNPNLSQRDLAKQLGVALGIANACVHALVRKGLVKIRGENNRSVTYHLTKSGLLHKSELALKWTKNTIGFYSEARHSVALKLASLPDQGVKTLVLYGANELAEIAAIVAPEVGLVLKGFIDGDGSGRQTMMGLPVGTEDLFAKTLPDAVVVCVEDGQEAAARLVKYLENGVKLYSLYSVEPADGALKTG